MRKGTNHTMTKAERRKIMERDDFTCVYCGYTATEVDHVLPVSLGEISTAENVVASCLKCNRIGWTHVFDSFQEKRDYILRTRQEREARCEDCELEIFSCNC